MAQKTPFDFSALFGGFDPVKLMQDYTASLGQFKAPGFDVDALVESQRKNVEALTAANRQAFEGVKAIAERQRDILQQAMQEAMSVASDVATSGSPQEAAGKQAEIFQKAMEKALETMREMAEMTSKTNQESFEILNQRFKENLAELRKVAGGK